MGCARVLPLIVLIVSVYGICPDDCPHKRLMFLYESFSCTPQCSPNSSDDCPSEYKCHDLNTKLDSCYFNGHYYNIGDNIENSLTWEHCLGCTCENATENYATFICYSPDCRVPPLKEGCRVNEKLGECCYSSEICPPLQTCTIDGQKFMQGEKFSHPSEKCTRCHCGEGEGKMADLRCEKQYCLDLLQDQSEIRRNCAPLYQTIDQCCPTTWICPEEIVRYEEGHGTETGSQCTFGKKRLNRGDKFFYSGAWGKATCECIIPPYASCIKTEEN